MNDLAYRELKVPSPYTGFDLLPIAGAWCRGGRQHNLEDRNPFTDEVILTIPEASRDDMDKAYTAAARAQISWAAATPMT